MNTVCDGIFSVALLGLTIWLILRGRLRFLTGKILISLILMYLMNLCFDMRNAIQLRYEGESYDEHFDNEWFFRALQASGFIIFFVLHWLITSQYLKVACLLKVTFSQHTTKDLFKMQKRKMILKFIDISFYGTLVIVEILAIVKPDIGNFILSTLWFLGAWAITFINYFSMRYIQACSKKVQSVGLEAS